MDIKNGIMETNEILTSLKKALAGLEIAEFEMNRPHEDVVSMSVCYGARQSLISLLQLYLEGENLTPSKNIKELYNECLKRDNRFAGINLTSIRCNEIHNEDCEGRYCLSVDKVSECVKVAKEVKTLVLEKFKINESELN